MPSPGVIWPLPSPCAEFSLDNDPIPFMLSNEKSNADDGSDGSFFGSVVVAVADLGSFMNGGSEKIFCISRALGARVADMLFQDGCNSDFGAGAVFWGLCQG